MECLSDNLILVALILPFVTILWELALVLAVILHRDVVDFYRNIMK